MNQADENAFYRKLAVQLEETSSWPSKYLYKFIVKTDVQKIKKIETYFDFKGAVINTNVSKNGKYTSVSINIIMETPESVINKYKEIANNVEGVISL
ncbi:MAG: DUF493 family protein [Flavobacteriaceae bacterium]|nr:DUF493 family protein [Flavobacteriaceae bacterium]MDG2350087.1 DUF493 family protein [Flavobacteriaceae bacterium]